MVKLNIFLHIILFTIHQLNPFLFIGGFSCPSSVFTSLTQNCPKLTIPDNCLPVSCGDKKILDLVLACKSGLIVPLLPLGPSCPLKTILLTDLLGCYSPLQIVMAIWRIFFKFEAYRTAITICRGLSRPTQQVQI
jgi:hypothetical protein